MLFRDYPFELLWQSSAFCSPAKNCFSHTRPCYASDDFWLFSMSEIRRNCLGICHDDPVCINSARRRVYFCLLFLLACVPRRLSRSFNATIDAISRYLSRNPHRSRHLLAVPCRSIAFRSILFENEKVRHRFYCNQADLWMKRLVLAQRDFTMGHLLCQP